MKAFEPEFAGKMNFYLSAVNDLLRHSDDQPSIGIILCKTRDRFVAEYALRDIKGVDRIHDDGMRRRHFTRRPAFTDNRKRFFLRVSCFNGT